MGIQLPEISDQQEDDFELFPENIPVLEAFFVLDGCAWQYTGMGDLVGLDYPAAKIIWDGVGMTLDTEAFKGVMIFSRTIADELRSRQAK